MNGEQAGESVSLSPTPDGIYLSEPPRPGVQPEPYLSRRPEFSTFEHIATENTRLEEQ